MAKQKRVKSQWFGMESAIPVMQIRFCLEIGASKFVVLSSKTVISRGTCVQKLNLPKRFSQSFCDGVSLYGLSVIIPLTFFYKKGTPPTLFKHF